jgi:hypothetical protein
MYLDVSLDYHFETGWTGGWFLHFSLCSRDQLKMSLQPAVYSLHAELPAEMQPNHVECTGRHQTLTDLPLSSQVLMIETSTLTIPKVVCC